MLNNNSNNNNVVETFNLIVTTLRQKHACKVGQSCPRLVYKTSMKSDPLFQKCWCCVARITFLLAEPGSNTRSRKVKMFLMAFFCGLCCIGSRLLLYVFLPWGRVKFPSVPEGFLQQGDAVCPAHFCCQGSAVQVRLWEGVCLVSLEGTE